MILSRAPLRISLGGGGTDLPSYYSKYGGFILSAAINKYVYIYVNRPSADNFIRVKYARYEQVVTVDEVQHDLVRPALKLQGITNNLEIASMADVPDGTGMGSSGSYLVALLLALFEFTKEKVSTAQPCRTRLPHRDRSGRPSGRQTRPLPRCVWRIHSSRYRYGRHGSC